CLLIALSTPAAPPHLSRLSLHDALPIFALVVGAARPLLFSSVDPDVARAAGVPVRLLGFGFLLVLGLSETQQAHGDSGSAGDVRDRKSTRLNSSHVATSYAVFCLKKKKK